MSDPPDDVEEVTFHPPHLEDTKGRLLPKALIPLCSYQGTMLGKGYKEFTACDKFQPSVMNGQLCYSLNISQAVSSKSKSGVRNSVAIVLDQPNSLELTAEETSVATIHLDTLGGFSDNRPGKYYMSALKKMTGTDAFMSLTDFEKKCQLELYEDCKNKQIFAILERECKCVPLEFSKFLKEKVTVVREVFN